MLEEERRARIERWESLCLSKDWQCPAFDDRFPDGQSETGGSQEFDFSEYVSARVLQRGITCRNCGLTFHEAARVQGRRSVRCPNCRGQIPLLAGTVFEGSKDLRSWIEACWILIGMPDGLSVSDLARVLNISYKKAAKIVEAIRCVWLKTNVKMLGAKFGSDVDPTPRVYEWIDSCWIEQEICGGHVFIILKMRKEYGATRKKSEINAGYWQEEVIIKFLPRGGPLIFSNRKAALQLILSRFVEAHSLIRRHEGWSRTALSVLGYKSRMLRSKEFSAKSVAEKFVNRLNTISHGRVTREGLLLYIAEFAYRFNTIRVTDRKVLFESLLTGLIG